MTDELDFTTLEKTLKIIGKHNRCKEVLDFGCGCAMIHGIFYHCNYHHKNMVEIAETLWKDANNEGLIIEELLGVKVCRTNTK